MSDFCEMKYGIDSRDNQRKHIDDIYEEYSKKPFLITCELCGGRIIPKCGTIRAHHFAHSFIGVPSPDQLICKSANTGMVPKESPWHRHWMHKFPERMQSKRVRYGGVDSKMANMICVADIMLENHPVVIEFQKGETSRKNTGSSPAVRTHFWNDTGYKTIWVFNETDTKSGNMTLLKDESVCKIYTDYLMKLFEKKQLQSERIEIHVHINGNYYHLFDFRGLEGKITEASVMDSYFNCLDIGGDDILDKVEDKLTAYIYWTHEMALKHKKSRVAGEKPRSSYFLASLLRQAKKDSKNCIGVINTESGNEYKISTSQADKAVIQGYFKKRSDNQYMEARNEIYYTERPVWQTKWQMPAKEA